MTIFHDSIHAYMAAINAMDPAAFAACFTEDCELNDPVGAPPHVGHGGARGFLSGMMPLVESVYIRPGKIQLNGRVAAFTWAIEAKGRNGKWVAADGIDVIEFAESGKIRRTSAYWDIGSFIAVLTA